MRSPGSPAPLKQTPSHPLGGCQAAVPGEIFAGSEPDRATVPKLKHWLRKAAKRTVEAVSHAIGQTLDTVTSAECRNYFSNSGYEPV